MELIIIVFGILIAASGCVLLARPAYVIDFIEQRAERPWVYALAVGVRAVVGVLLIVLAEQSRFPLALAIFGWLILAAAVLLLAMGRARFTRLVRWVMAKVKPWCRWGGPFAIALGLFLVYAFM